MIIYDRHKEKKYKIIAKLLLDCIDKNTILVYDTNNKRKRRQLRNRRMGPWDDVLKFPIRRD